MASLRVGTRVSGIRITASTKSNLVQYANKMIRQLDDFSVLSIDRCVKSSSKFRPKGLWVP